MKQGWYGRTLLLLVALPISTVQADDGTPGSVVSVFETRSLLSTPGQVILEPSVSWAHATSTQVAIEGLTIIPALVVGLINVSQVQRDVATAALALRTGITDRSEVSVKIPWVHVRESIRERKAFDASPVDILHDSSGSDMGDIELGWNYQLSNGMGEGPQYIANLRIKAPTGKDPFEIDKRTLSNPDGMALGVVFDEQPTGSGFWAVQPGVSLLYPTDPAVLYGSLSYLANIAAEKGAANGGRIDPGDALGFSMGIGFAVNEQTSFSLGYDHSIVYKTDIELADDRTDASFNRLQSGSLLLGVSQRLSAEQSLNVSLGVGATDNAPDIQLTLRLPTTY